MNSIDQIIEVRKENISFYFDDSRLEKYYTGNINGPFVLKRKMTFGFDLNGFNLDRNGLDRWGFCHTKNNLKLFERFKAAVISLQAFNSFRLMVDINGRTYANVIWNEKIPYGISAKHMNADLIKIGF